MKKCFAILLLALIWPGSTGKGQILFRDAFKDKYEHKRVNCYLCHERVERDVEDPRRFRNETGELFFEQLKGENVTERLKVLGELNRTDPVRVAGEQEIVERFLLALEEVEKMEMASGGTYGEAFKNGSFDEITVKDDDQ